MNATIDNLIAVLSPQDAWDYDLTDEKHLFVTDILDINNLPRRDSYITRIEDALEAILASLDE